MKKLKQFALALTLCGAFGTGAAPQALAQEQAQTQVQDGIRVKPLSRLGQIVPEEQINQAAAQQYQQLIDEARQQGALLPASHPQVQRLRAIASRIIPHTARWNPDAVDWNWQINVIDAPQVNAFVMPGGRIGFYTGILEQLKLTDDEVAAIMGHEIAHALREHARERTAKTAATGLAARGLGALAAGIFGIDPNIAGTVSSYIGQGVVLKFSRDEEREADLVGLDISSRAGFDPRAGIVLWQKMGALDRRRPLELLSTHPGGDTRIADIQKHMHLLLPLYARTKGTTVAKLPPYRTNVTLR